MYLTHPRRLLLLTLLGICTQLCASSAASAAAPTTPFGCRASSTRADTSLTTVEPLVANRATTPCSTQSDGVTTAPIPDASSNPVVAGPAGVFTYSANSAPTTTGAVAPGAAALASVQAVAIPTSGGQIVLTQPTQATASYACEDGQVVGTSSSNVNSLQINGKQYTPPTPGAQATYNIGGGATVTINETLKTASSLTQRAIDIHLSQGNDIVVAEAEVTQSGTDPCAGTTGTNPPTVTICPTGSTYDPATGQCVIFGTTTGGGSGGGGSGSGGSGSGGSGGSGGGGGTTVTVISSPFAGPTGGTVIPLSVARKRYKSACLSGPGPNYAIVGTNGSDRINGTRRAERILGLGGNDRIAGQGGSDCIDGGAGNDRIWGGNGNNRDYGGPGTDRIAVGNSNTFADGGRGNDRIYLGNGTDVAYGDAGNDVISVGRGNDRIYGGAGNDHLATSDGNDSIWGGAGNDHIWAGNGKDHVYGGAGNDRLFSAGRVSYLNCGAGARDIAFTDALAIAYAQHHGCEVHRGIRPRKLA
jgi:Ca2+-binding RTX toxin-like protein